MKYGVTIKVDNQAHNHTFVGKKKNKFPPMCGSCGYYIPDGFPVLECEPCNLKLCKKCESS